jgi:hypothetical protein
LDYLSCIVEIARPVKDRSLNTTTAIMSHDDDLADVEVHHAVRDGGHGTVVVAPVLVRDVAVGEKSAGEGSKDISLRNPGVTV